MARKPKEDNVVVMPKRGPGRPRKERPGIGDNSGVLSGDSQRQIRGLAGRIIALLDERDEVNTDIKTVFDEAREAGFDTKIMRKAIKEARADKAALQAERDMIDMYLHAIVGELLDSLEPTPQDEPAPADDPGGPTIEETVFDPAG